MIVYHTVSDVSTAPTFSINLNSKYLTGTYTIIDLSWYAPYKQYGDSVITMFFYLGFIWHVFTKLASIISGSDTSYSRVETPINTINMNGKGVD